MAAYPNVPMAQPSECVDKRSVLKVKEMNGSMLLVLIFGFRIPVFPVFYGDDDYRTKNYSSNCSLRPKQLNKILLLVDWTIRISCYGTIHPLCLNY